MIAVPLLPRIGCVTAKPFCGRYPTKLANSLKCWRSTARTPSSGTRTFGQRIRSTRMTKSLLPAIKNGGFGGWPEGCGLNTDRIPVIVDTDIGDDIDDLWALAYLLAHERCDVQLVVTTFGDRKRQLQRAGLIQRLLKEANQAHVPVALGVPSWGTGKGAFPQNRPPCSQAAWAPPASPESVVENGVGAMCATIHNSPRPLTVLSLGPMTNIAELVKMSGDTVSNAHLVGMQGSVYCGYKGSSTTCAEHNVACDPGACAASIAAPWASVTLAPLDVCGNIHIKGDQFRQLVMKKDQSPLCAAVLDGNSAWAESSETVKTYYPRLDSSRETTCLFDTAAAFLALHRDGGDLMQVERDLRLRVTARGFTEVVEGGDGTRLNCATGWVEGGNDQMVEDLVSTLTRANIDFGSSAALTVLE
mmetsp:Transcript_11482/g.21922  ORF Transcript_11482/g.21922 Transcript_11482/m.21922 type:complete len:417 (+) Transcript_11482:124-1374(+)